jgi:hypothetical protein
MSSGKILMVAAVASSFPGTAINNQPGSRKERDGNASECHGTRDLLGEDPEELLFYQGGIDEFREEECHAHKKEQDQSRCIR